MTAEKQSALQTIEDNNEGDRNTLVAFVFS